jgi:hypothetical protein
VASWESWRQSSPRTRIVCLEWATSRCSTGRRSSLSGYLAWSNQSPCGAASETIELRELLSPTATPESTQETARQRLEKLMKEQEERRAQRGRASKTRRARGTEAGSRGAARTMRGCAPESKDSAYATGRLPLRRTRREGLPG